MTTTLPSFTSSDLQRWHPTELALQETRGFADAVFEGPSGLSSGLIQGSDSFLRQLQLLPLTTLDEQGRPWVSLLSSVDGQAGFIESLKGEGQEQEGLIRFNVRLAQGTPLREHLNSGKEMNVDPGDHSHEGKRRLAATVGVLLSNRRRNKYDGWIHSAKCVDQQQDLWEVEMVIAASMGNCPKYINTRTLLPSTTHTTPSLPIPSSLSHSPSTPIDPLILSAITQADLIYLGTLHTGSTQTWYTDRTKLGCNIRGGRRGFLRHYWDSDRSRHCILLPDFSGNRFLQSLGNIVGDPVAGLAIPVFHTAADAKQQQQHAGSDVVYLTCEAEVLSGEEATKVMRGFQGLVKLWITGYTYVKDALPLLEESSQEHQQQQQQQQQGIGWSPYNPPIRYAAHESGHNIDASTTDQQQQLPEATLQDVISYSSADDPNPQILTFIFHLPASAPSASHSSLLKHYQPGQHIITDSHHLLDTRVTLYNHMTQFPGGEKELNDDGTRSWTLSSACASAAGGGGGTFEVTLRRIPRGGVTPNLFNMGRRAVQHAKDNKGEFPPWTPRLKVLGVEGGFTLPSPSGPPPSEHTTTAATTTRTALMYLCSGIGITPFLAHLAGLRRAYAAGNGTGTVTVVLVLAVKQDEVDVFAAMIRRTLEQVQLDSSMDVKLQVHILSRGVQQPQEHPAVPVPMPIQIQMHTDRRLTVDSLSLSSATTKSTSTDASPEASFQLPHSTLADFSPSHSMELTRRFYICGSTTFQDTAMRALHASDALAVQDGEVVMEKFTY